MKFKTILLAIVIAVLFAFSNLCSAGYWYKAYPVRAPLDCNGKSGVISFLYDTGHFYVAHGELHIMDGNYPSINDYVARTDSNYVQHGAGSVTTPDINDGDITSPKIGDGEISGADVNDNAVTSSKIKDGEISNVDVNDGAITSPKIKDGEVSEVDVNDGAVTSSKIKNGEVSTPDMNNQSYLPFESGSKFYVATVTIGVLDINQLSGTPKTLVAAPGTHNYIELISASLIYDYNTTAWERVSANMTVKYTDGSGAAASGTLAGNGFLDQTADKIAKLLPVAVASTTATSIENQPLVLSMATADPCGADGITATSPMRAKVVYAIHPSGL